MKSKAINIFVASIVLLLGQVRAQQVKVLKDSVQIDGIYYVLEEIKLDNKNVPLSAIYQKIRNPHILGSYISATPEQRLSAKKDTLKALMTSGELRQSGYGFEHYEVFYHKSGILNLLVNVQSYGSPFETKRYHCFDLNTGKILGKALFANHESLLEVLSEKLKMQKKGIKVSPAALDQYQIISDEKGHLNEIIFCITDTGQYRNSGYETFEVRLGKKELAFYLTPQFRKRLLE
ncbi:hypothetical protein [Pedobacter nanyangensis]|uniref:hypothetical protein n=1 Tax=Pedobacter nanyangensis TaxID=1562389 RepID=UPI000DE57206|nr:hypothetical protein [Pedobacter nanyangensis]